MNIDQNQRDLLSSLADELIPAGDGMPSASEAGVSGMWLDEVLTVRPDLAGKLFDLLHKARGRAPAEFVASARANDPATFGVLTEIVTGAYFMNPEVRQAIGYTGQSARPIDPRPDYLDDDLLDSVIQRGPIFRPTLNRIAP